MIRLRQPRLLRALVGTVFVCLVVTGTARAGEQSLSSRPDIREFIERMNERHGFEPAALRSLLDEVELRDQVIEAITTPAEAKPWHQYRPIFVTPARTRQGVEFWNEHAALLERAEQIYGVPAEIIVAIIGVETRYGRHTGGHPVLDALATLAFEYPPRAKFFRRELEELLLLAREEGLDVSRLEGSYAGAMGQPQFIASSYRRYAVDFDGDGQRDLFDDIDDVVGSVANYFALHRWHTGAPVALPATVEGELPDPLLDGAVKPRWRLAELERRGIRAKTSLPPDTRAAVIALETSDGATEYWLGLHNFYVITRYNRSALYAMAVYQLSRAIAEQRGQSG